MSFVETGQISAVETGQMSAAETGQMSAVETGQMSAVEVRQMSTIETALNRGHPGWLFQPWNSRNSGLELAEFRISIWCRDSPVEPVLAQDDGSSTHSPK